MCSVSGCCRGVARWREVLGIEGADFFEKDEEGSKGAVFLG